jgi:hypothetical protein
MTPEDRANTIALHRHALARLTKHYHEERRTRPSKVWVVAKRLMEAEQRALAEAEAAHCYRPLLSAMPRDRSRHCDACPHKPTCPRVIR